jgi:signal transduction histidine kinase
MRLSTFILSNMESILRDWMDFARSLGDVTSSMDAKALLDHAELILRAVAVDLETPQSAAQQEAKSEGDAPARQTNLPATAATSHGMVRAAEGFTLEQMVSEFRAVRASVLRQWSKVQTSPNPDSFEQLMRFNEAIDEALADSIKTYSHAVDQMAVNKARSRMEALGTLSAGLGHDMANVLMPMRMCLGMLADRGLNAETAPLVEALHRAVGHLSGLAKGLRALSMDPTDSAGAPDSTVLHEWWSNAISPFTWALPPGVVLHAEGLGSIGKTLPPVQVPAHVLMQAVFNIVQNAAQALAQRNAANPRPVVRSLHVEPTGNIWVTAALEPSELAPEKPTYIRLTVRDDSPGMDARTLEHCTDAFFTTKAKNLGTGLGLYLVRSVVERHHGKLLVESKLGEGTSCSLLLPVAPST